MASGKPKQESTAVNELIALMAGRGAASSAGITLPSSGDDDGLFVSRPPPPPSVVGRASTMEPMARARAPQGTAEHAAVAPRPTPRARTITGPHLATAPSVRARTASSPGLAPPPPARVRRPTSPSLPAIEVAPAPLPPHAPALAPLPLPPPATSTSPLPIIARTKSVTLPPVTGRPGRTPTIPPIAATSPIASVAPAASVAPVIHARAGRAPTVPPPLPARARTTGSFAAIPSLPPPLPARARTTGSFAAVPPVPPPRTSSRIDLVVPPPAALTSIPMPTPLTSIPAAPAAVAAPAVVAPAIVAAPKRRVSETLTVPRAALDAGIDISIDNDIVVTPPARPAPVLAMFSGPVTGSAPSGVAAPSLPLAIDMTAPVVLPDVPAATPRHATDEHYVGTVRVPRIPQHSWLRRMVTPLVALSLIGVGAGIYLAADSAPAAPAPVVMSAAPAAAPMIADEARATATVTPIQVAPIEAAPVAVEAAPVAVEAAPVVDAPVAVAPVEPAPLAAVEPAKVAAVEPAKVATRAPTRERERERERAPREARKVRTATAEPAPRAQPLPVAKAAAVRGNGVLMISSKPPCEIVIDGKATGLMTPQRALALPAGAHEVTLINRDLKVRNTSRVTIKPDDTTKLIKKLMP